ncbi:hypothetical protein AAHN93_04225 [Vandammella animalimorsus]|uniref:hypothetical protein n=1 Tax=Vandammella animalimorsus TaxID=2029117 RepID=UPI0031BB0F4F
MQKESKRINLHKIFIILLKKIGSSSASTKITYINRESLDPRIWINQIFRDTSNDAIKVVKLISKSYGIPPEKLRIDDKISEIMKTDWFGDSDIELMWLLRECGLDNISGNLKIGDLISIVTPFSGDLALKMQHMYGDGLD